MTKSPTHPRLIVGDDTGTVYALGTKLAHTYWTASIGDYIPSDPIIHRKTVYVCTSPHTLTAFALSDGSEKWSFDTQTSFQYLPIINPITDSVYLFTEKATVALFPDVGGKKEIVVEWQTNHRPNKRPVLAPDGQELYLPGCGDGLTAISVHNGTENWQLPLYYETSSIYKPPITTQDSIIIPTSVGHKYSNHNGAVNLYNFDGSFDKRIKLKNKRVVVSQPATDQSSLYFATSGRIHSYDLDSPTENWDHKLSTQTDKISLSVCSGDLIIHIDLRTEPAKYDAKILSLNTSDGSLNWSKGVEPSINHPASCNGNLYISDSTGKIFGISTETGSLRYSAIAGVFKKHLNGATATTLATSP
jgi:outer membrane protein assembly factor BamB